MCSSAVVGGKKDFKTVMSEEQKKKEKRKKLIELVLNISLNDIYCISKTRRE